MKGAVNPIPSEFVDIRARSGADENKRFYDSINASGLTDVQLNVPPLIQQINVGYNSDERCDSKIVITSFVLSGVVKINSFNVMSPANFGNATGRLFVVADTQYRSQPVSPLTLDLADVFVASSPSGCLSALEKIENGDRFVVLSREPIDIKIEACAVSVINEVPAFDALPRFEADCEEAHLTDVNNERYPYSITGGALYDPDAKKYLNVGAHYNLDVSQQDKDPTGQGVLYPRTNVVNIAPVTWGGLQPQQVEFIPTPGGGIPCGVNPAMPFQSIYDRADYFGYPRDELPRLATGALTFPKYVYPSYNIGSTITYATTNGTKLIDLEIDFPDGIFVEYNEAGLPDIEIFAVLVMTGGVYLVEFNCQTAVYFTDDDVWGMNSNVKAGTAFVDPVSNDSAGEWSDAGVDHVPFVSSREFPSPPALSKRRGIKRERSPLYDAPKRKFSFSGNNKRFR